MDFGEFMTKGIPVKVSVETDAETALYLAGAIFLGMVLALAVYAKLMR